MGDIVNLAIRKAANTSFFSTFGEAVKVQPWRKGAGYLGGNGKVTEYFNWLGEMSGVKRWLDERQIRALQTMSHQATALRWEDTIGIEVNALNEDGPLIKQRIPVMAQKFAQHPNKVFFDFLKAGDGMQAAGGAKATYPYAGCFDTQTFFSNSHPVYSPDIGVGTTNDNITTGTAVDTVAHIQADFDSAIQGFYNLILRDGTPIFDDIPEPLIVYCAAEDIALFRQAFLLPTYVATALPNPYYNRAIVIPTAHLNTDTAFSCNDYSSIYTQESWFVQIPGIEMPLFMYESSPIELVWDESDKFMKDKVYYGGKGMYNMVFAYWQTMQRVYNA